MTETIKKYGYFLILAVVFVLGIVLRLKWLIANPSFWDDECSLAWNVVHKNYSQFFSVLGYVQVAPPFFMITAKLFIKIFGVSDFVLRLAPFLFGVLSMIIFFIISNKLFENKITAVASALIFSMNAALVNYSSEFKQYSCDVFFTLLCFYLFFDIVSNKLSAKKIIIYSIVFALSIWFSFISALIIAAGFAVVILKQLREKTFNLKKFSFFALPFLLSALFYLKFYILKTYTTNILELNNYWQNSYIAKDFSNFFALVIKDIGYFIFPSTFVMPALLALIVGVMVLFKKKFYPALILVLTILFECIASWLGFYPFEKRVILFLLPIVLIFIVSTLELLDVKHKIKSALVLILFVSVFVQTFLYSYQFMKTPKPNRGYYPREMMATMMEKIKPDDVILVNMYSRTDFAYYSDFYKIKNKVIQQGWMQDREQFLNSLEPKKYYWFYMPFGPSVSFDKWFPNQKRQIIFEINGNAYPSKLVYFYLR